MKHHIMFKRGMNVSIKVEPTIEVVLEARNGIMTENDFITVVFYFLIFTNLHKALLKVDVVATVMISLDENFLTVELLKDFNGFCRLAPKHIADDIDCVARTNNRIPSADKFRVVFLDGLERTIVKCKTIGVSKMQVRNIKLFCISHYQQFPFLFPINIHVKQYLYFYICLYDLLLLYSFCPLHICRGRPPIQKDILL